MSTGKVATGSAVFFALGLEQQFGVRDATAVAFDPVLPIDGGLTATESPPIQVNRGGYVRAGVPGPKGGELGWGHRLTVAHQLEYLEHVIGNAVRDVPEAGVYRYVFEPPGPADHVTSSFWGIVGWEPVDRYMFFGSRFGKLEMQLGDNVAIPVRLSGLLAHGTRLGPVEPQPGNLGTYARGPHVRGVLSDPDAGDVWVKITRDVLSGGLRYTVEQTTDTPTYPGVEVDVLYDEDGNGGWQNVQGADGLDLGSWGSNKDPLEIIWPGTSTDHGFAAVGDEFCFPVAWTPPAISMITAGQDFTSAHWSLRVRAVGGASYREISVNSGTIGIEASVEADRGNSSRYPHDVQRVGDFRPTIQLERGFVDRTFADLLDRHQRIDVEPAFVGRQLGTGVYRESLTLRLPSAGIPEQSAALSDAGRISETVQLVGETDDAGNPPLTVTAICDRDWTPTS